MEAFRDEGTSQQNKQHGLRLEKPPSEAAPTSYPDGPSSGAWVAQGPPKQASFPEGPGPILWEPLCLPPAAPHLRDGLHHGEPHEDGADGVVLAVVRQPADAVVTVTQDLNPQLVVFLKGQGVDWGPEAPPPRRGGVRGKDR